MSESTDVTDLLDALAKVLLRCFALGFLLLLIWFGVFVLAGDVIHNLHGKMFGLSPHELNLDLDSGLIKLPMPALCVRFPQENNPLIFDWKGEEIPIRCILMGDMNQGKGISILIDVGEVMGDGSELGVPIYTYRNFRRESGLTVEAAIRELGPNTMADLGVQIPDPLVMDCIRLCCSLCLLENDPSIISPDVLSKDRDRFEKTSDEKYVDKAHRRGKVGWDVGRQVEVMPHYRRPHLQFAWTGTGRAVPKIVPRRRSIVHRSAVEKVPSGFDA